MRQSILLFLVVCYCPLVASEQIPLPSGTEVSVETRTKTLRGTLQASVNANWVGIVEPGMNAPTLIPITAIEAIRPASVRPRPIRAPVARPDAAEPEREEVRPIDEEPLEIDVRISRDREPKVVVAMRANQVVDPVFLEMVFLGVAEPNEEAMEGFVKSAPRKKVLLRLPANASFAKRLDAFAAGEERQLEFPFSLDPITGRGGVIATAGSQLPAQGEPGAFAPIDVLESAYSVFTVEDGLLVSGSSFLDVKIKQLTARGGVKAVAEPNEAFDDTIERLKRAGASATKEVTGQPENAADNRGEAEASAIRVHGTVRFTDISGGTHPVPSVTVEVWDDNLGADRRLGTGATDVEGRYALIVSPEAGDQPDLYVIARAIGASAKVEEFASGATWAVDSLPAINDVPDGTSVQVNLTANNDEMNHPSNVAFEIYSAVDVMARRLVQLGQPAPRRVRLRYPRPGDSSDYLNDVIRLGGSDAHDWDNIQHEYGHHVQAVFGISQSPGGRHGLNENLCNSRGKRDGIRLAWGEGWPTFFSLMTQAEDNLSLLNIPNLGDTRYTDTKPAGFDIEYDIENDFGQGGEGEGNEIAVQRILWDLYDDNPAETEQVTIGPGELFALAVDHRSVTLSHFWNALISNRPANEAPAFGAVLAAHDVSPSPQSPAEGTAYNGGPAPSFSWSGDAGCGMSGQTRFQIVFFDNDFANPRFTSGLLTAMVFVPTPAERDQIFGGSNGTLRWAVRVLDRTSPQTGSYMGPSRTIVDRFDP